MNLNERLQNYFIENSRRVCSTSHTIVKDKYCSCCGSDDLMFLYEDCGPTWNIEDITASVLRDSIWEADFEGDYDEVLDEQPEIVLFDISYTYSELIKKVDPIAYQVGLQDFICHQLGEEIYIEVDGRYYETYEVERFLDYLGA